MTTDGAGRRSDPQAAQVAFEAGIRARPRPSKWLITWRIALLFIGAVTLYGLAPKLLDLWAQVPQLRTLNIPWFVVMVAMEAASYVSAWWLIRIAVPSMSWFVASTSHLAANAVAKIVPGGAAMGAATQYRMFAAAGVERPTAATALAATSIISNGVLFALPMVALVGSIIGAPIPHTLGVIAWGGALLFLALFAVTFTIVKFDRPLHAVGRLVERVGGWIYTKLHKPGGPTAQGLVDQRDQMLEALDDRWWQALAAAVGNWMFDYLALVAALFAVGAKPRLSLVLLAYGAAAVLSMIPITPGGLGFVEAGLAATLVVAGVGGEEALLATLAYRVASYWLPLPAGLVAQMMFRHRFKSSNASPDTPTATT